MSKHENISVLATLVVLVMLAVPFICLVSTIAAAPVRTAADAASGPVRSGAADWSSAVMVLMAVAGIAWVVVSLSLRCRFGKPANQDGGDADYQRRFFQPVETDPLWQAAHTDMVVTGDMTTIPGDLSGRLIKVNPSPTGVLPAKMQIGGKPHAARGEKAGER
jgi:hypothetical protein